MARECRCCDYFEHHQTKPDREGFCDYHKDFFLPTGGCKHFKRIDAEEYPGSRRSNEQRS